MDAENLRDTYNQYFSQSHNRWTTSDLKRSIRIARKVNRWLRQAGFSKDNASLLDVGSATGFYTEAFRLVGYNSTGLEYADVAIEQARSKFPACEFVQMNGFEPDFKKSFDVVFCRGFSGVNTHDLNFISGWVNRYMKIIAPDGFFILAYSTDYSGKEEKGETVNFSKQELTQLAERIDGKLMIIHHDHFLGWISRIKKWLWSKLLRKKQKLYFYMFFRKE